MSNSCQAKVMTDVTEQAVIVHFNYNSADLQPLFLLEKKLENVISTEAVGEFDGYELATDGRDGYFYMYSPDADKLFETVKPVLESSQFLKGATVTKRYGPPEENVRESIVKIAP